MTTVYNFFKKHMWDGYSVFERMFMASMVLLQIVVFCITPR